MRVKLSPSRFPWVNVFDPSQSLDCLGRDCFDQNTSAKCTPWFVQRLKDQSITRTHLPVVAPSKVRNASTAWSKE